MRRQLRLIRTWPPLRPNTVAVVRTNNRFLASTPRGRYGASADEPVTLREAAAERPQSTSSSSSSFSMSPAEQPGRSWAGVAQPQRPRVASKCCQSAFTRPGGWSSRNAFWRRPVPRERHRFFPLRVVGARTVSFYVVFPRPLDTPCGIRDSDLKEPAPHGALRLSRMKPRRAVGQPKYASAA